MKTFAFHSAFVAALVAIFATAEGTAQVQGRPTVSGLGLFSNYCATCHGESAQGDGPLAAMLRKRPANLTLLARSNGGVFSPEMVAQIVDGRKPLAGHGGGDMPAWGDAFARSAEGAESIPDKIKAIVTYLETIQKKP